MGVLNDQQDHDASLQPNKDIFSIYRHDDRLRLMLCASETGTRREQKHEQRHLEQKRLQDSYQYQYHQF